MHLNHLVCFLCRGARHGLQLSGKLQRLEQQEERLLSKQSKKAQQCNKRDNKCIEDEINPKVSLEKSSHFSQCNENKKKRMCIQENNMDMLMKCNQKNKTKQNICKS